MPLQGVQMIVFSPSSSRLRLTWTLIKSHKPASALHYSQQWSSHSCKSSSYSAIWPLPQPKSTSSITMISCSWLQQEPGESSAGQLDIFLSCEILFLHFIQSNLLLSYCYRSFSQVRSAVEQYLAVDGVQTHPQGSPLQGNRRRGLVYVTDDVAAVFYCPQSGGCLTIKFDLNAPSPSPIHPTSSPSNNLRC